MENNILDVPTEEDIYEDNIHDKLMCLTGTDVINGVRVTAIFDEKIHGDNYYTYIIGGEAKTFIEAFNILISK